MPKRTKKSDVLEEKKDISTEEKRDFSGLIRQIDAEYKIAWKFMKPKIDDWGLRLKVYANKKREKTAIGDPLLFTIFQTVLASLYNDRLIVSFEGREEGDEEVAMNLVPMAEYDYEQMQKAQLDYDWDFNTLFYGRALMLNLEFSREKMCPLPEVIDMLTWLRDPKAKSVNGDVRGRGAMRFGGREISLYKTDMDKAGIYFGYNELKGSAGHDPQSLLDNSESARRAQQGFDESNKGEGQLIGDNVEIRALEWFTYWKGKKVLVTLADNRTKVIRYKELEDQTCWPIDERVCYPMSHDWDGVSVPDLIEDKQRARAVVQNKAFEGIKTGQETVYLYDANKIKNRGNLQPNFNRHVPVDGSPSGAVQAIDRQQVKQEVDWILNVLERGAQGATASPATRQGSSSDNGTATEANLQAQGVDTRYSLTAKIWGWSEKEFWAKWYRLYKRHFEDKIDEKSIRINGALGAKFRKLTRENIIAETDPDITIESKAISDAQKINDLQKYRLFLKDVQATAPQEANTRFALRHIGRLSGFKKDIVDQVLPPSVDEMEAEEENVMLDNNVRVDVEVTDDDFVHMEIHNKAADTPAKYAHIRAHRKAMMLKRRNPQLDMARNRPQEGVDAANFAGSFAPQPGGQMGIPAQPPQQAPQLAQ